MPGMHYDSLISVAQTLDIQQACVIVDCRFSLTDPNLGASLFADSHIPGAHFLDLNKDLSSSVTADSGRHPLPSPDTLAARLQHLGLNADQQLIAYDDQSGAFAARLWWLCRWLGHSKAAVLDGGFAAWLAAGGAIERGVSGQPPRRGNFQARIDNTLVLSAKDVEEALRHGQIELIDARGIERFSGETEPLDTVAGHIPGAINRPFIDNLHVDGHFRPKAELRERFQSTQKNVHMCGSGVTACHNILASVHAGLEMPALYPGSWSEWIRDPARPVAQGMD